MVVCSLAEEDGDPYRYRVPTRANLTRALRWLLDGAAAGDSLVFHFSGHGVQKLDSNGDEADGYDEALCPVDFEDPRGGVILDDEINATIVRPLGRGVKLHAIVDTCHRGTILDLPYLCRLSRYTSSSLHHITRTRSPQTNQWNNPGLILELNMNPSSSLQDRVLSMVPVLQRAEMHQRRPHHLDQRLRREPNLARHHGQ